MEQKPRRPHPRSIDGFIIPPIKQAQRINPNPLSPNIDLNNTDNKTVESPKNVTEPAEFNKYYSQTSKAEPLSRRGKAKKKWTRKRKITTSALALLLVGFGIGAWYGAQILGSLNKVLHGNVFSDVHALFSNVKLKGEDQGRVNILLAGDSADDPGHGGANLTDSIMVLSIDTKTHNGFMMSIPRDLWVALPGWGHEKINAANEANNFHQTGYPSGGMGQLEQVVQTDLGIPINYYALIDYTAFKDSVNTVGGITININSPDHRGIYDAYTNLKIPNGNITLTGQQALNLARARGDAAAGDVSYGLPNSDFDRTQHQREMLVALAQKAQTAGVIANPIKVSQLFKTFGNHIHTDLNLQDVLRFIQITKGINITHLQSLTYAYGGKNSLLTNYLSPSGALALIPKDGVDNFGGLQQFYQQLTSNNPVVREAPSVVVLNGSGVTGLAHKEATTLTSEGFNVVGVSDANSQYSSSMIVDLSNNQKPASKQLLQTLLPRGTTSSTTAVAPAEAAEAAGYTANFVIVLGQNSTTAQQP